MQRASAGSSGAHNFGGARVSELLLIYLLVTAVFVIVALVIEDDGQPPVL